MTPPRIPVTYSRHYIPYAVRKKTALAWEVSFWKKFDEQQPTLRSVILVAEKKCDGKRTRQEQGYDKGNATNEPGPAGLPPPVGKHSQA